MVRADRGHTVNSGQRRSFLHPENRTTVSLQRTDRRNPDDQPPMLSDLTYFSSTGGARFVGGHVAFRRVIRLSHARVSHFAAGLRPAVGVGGHVPPVGGEKMAPDVAASDPRLSTGRRWVMSGDRRHPFMSGHRADRRAAVFLARLTLQPASQCTRPRRADNADLGTVQCARPGLHSVPRTALCPPDRRTYCQL